jgi:dUTP pyrophosphatase
MDAPVLLVKRLCPEALIPHAAHPGDAGLDLFSVEALVLPAGAARMVRTGIALELPSGTEAQVRPRSGLALKHAVTVLNAPGTIDAGYRGEVGVILINHGRQPFQVEQGMKIAQLVVQPVLAIAVRESEILSGTARGAGGFGSTGMTSTRQSQD